MMFFLKTSPAKTSKGCKSWMVIQSSTFLFRDTFFFFSGKTNVKHEVPLYKATLLFLIGNPPLFQPLFVGSVDSGVTPLPPSSWRWCRGEGCCIGGADQIHEGRWNSEILFMGNSHFEPKKWRFLVQMILLFNFYSSSRVVSGSPKRW